MAYEVPQELEYKEKIIFGLDFEQLIYAIIFAPLALIIFFKSGLNQELKIVLGSFIVIIAGGFIFLNFKQRLLDFWSWYKFREFKVATVTSTRVAFINEKLLLLSMKRIKIKGALHYSKSRIVLMFWNGELFKAIIKLKEEGRYAKLKWGKGNSIILIKSKGGIKLTPREKQRHIICSANKLFKNKSKIQFFKKNYIPIIIEINPKEWNLNENSFLLLNEMVDKVRENHNENEKSLTVYGALTTSKGKSGVCLTIYSKPLCEKINNFKKEIKGIAYWKNNILILHINKKYGRKIIPVIKQKQCKLTCSNLIPYEERRDYFKEKNYQRVRVRIFGLSTIGMNRYELFAETKEQGQLAKSFFELNHEVKRDTKNSKYAADLILDGSLIEVTALTPGKKSKDNTPSGSLWGSMAARIIKLVKGAEDFKKDQKHFLIAKREWLNAPGNKIVTDYITWIKDKFNIYFIPADFNNKNWSKNVANKIIELKYNNEDIY